MSLVTLAEAKAYLTITTASKDALINALILSVTDFMKNSAINRNLEQVNYKQLYDGNGLDRILLDEFPIISVTVLSLSVDIPNKEYDDALTEGTEFFKAEGGFIELVDNVFVEGRRMVYIDFNAGYAVIPGDIKDVCNQLIAKRVKQVADQNWNITTKNIFDDSVSFESGDLTDGMKKVIKKYRKRPSSLGVDVTGWTAA